MKVFNIIGDYGQEDEQNAVQQESSEESDQWEEVKTTHEKKKANKNSGKKQVPQYQKDAVFSEENIFKSKSSVELDQPVED